MEQEVILVDEHDVPIGTMGKMEAHCTANLHRAFSVFIFNAKGEMLVQQRASTKYHSGGLWTNACCSHPMPGEDTAAAAMRRLREELGFETRLQEAFSFTYQARFDNGLTEYEFDHVFIGHYEGAIHADPNEVGDHAYLSIDEIARTMRIDPDRYTAWFKIALPRLEAYLAAHGSLPYDGSGT